MLVKACLNGSRKPEEHLALPLTPEDLAQAARASVEAGAGAIHMHPRDVQGAQSLAPTVIANALQAVRAICPGVPLGVSTGFWIEGTAERRLTCVWEWQVLPDFASVNFDEPGAIELCALLLERGIGIEAGLDGEEATTNLLRSGLAERCLRILLEPGEVEVGEVLRNAKGMLTRLGEAGVRRPLLLHGVEQAAWGVLEAALAGGYDTRIGFEDTLTLPDGCLAASNAELVAVVSRKRG